MTTTSFEGLNTLIEHFESVPWCGKILRAPGIVPFVPPSRQTPQQQPEGALPSRDQLFSRLLYNEEGVPYFVGFYQDPLLQSEPASKYPDLPFLARSLSNLFDLRSGLSGFNGPAHGGFIGKVVIHSTPREPLVDKRPLYGPCTRARTVVCNVPALFPLHENLMWSGLRP
ncbi:hypothetical protein F5B20DRAFT_595280 [Whalleya microplaca]|nr:hypothetical protein F5B20DRAFT_595280 [Whalleya microplaca]